MPAINRMSRSTRWMRAVWSRPLRAGVPCGKQRPRKPTQFQIGRRRGRRLPGPAFCWRHIRRWPCLIRSGPAEAAERAAVAEQAEQAEVAAVAPEVVEPAAVARVAALAEVGAAARVVAAQEALAGLVAAVKAEPVARAARVEEHAAEPAEAPAEEALIPIPITTIQPTASHGRLFRNFRLRLRPTSRSSPLLRKERAASRFSTPTISSPDSNASDVNRMSSTSWVTCRRIRPKGLATR